MKKYIFTDLACEAVTVKNGKKTSLSKNIYKVESYRGVTRENGARAEQRFVTIFSPKLWLIDDNEFFVIKDEIVAELKKFIECLCRSKHYNEMSYLLVGMGNPYFCSDALGVETAKKITATRQVKDGMSNGVAVVIPDVTGNTGIETADVVKAYSEIVKPDIIIVIDSLASKSSERLASTIQITNRGITPGGGIGIGRVKLSEEGLGAPIISIGVPTVINSSTIIANALERLGAERLEANIIDFIMSEAVDTFVTPKEADLLIKTASLLIANAIDEAIK